MDELSSLEDLLDLQDVDLQIDRLLNERQTLPELDEYRRAHAAADAVSAERDKANAALRDTSLELDKASGELELTELKLDSEQNRLYAGGLSARDADYLRQEVGMLDRKKTEMEDRALELMEHREKQEAEVAVLTTAVIEAEEELGKLDSVIQDTWEGIDAQLAVKESRKSDIVPLILDSLLELYEELRPVKEGVAVGRLADGVCGGCHLTLTAAEQLDLKRSDPPRCLHCRRILVP